MQSRDKISKKKKKKKTLLLALAIMLSSPPLHCRENEQINKIEGRRRKSSKRLKREKN